VKGKRKTEKEENLPPLVVALRGGLKYAVHLLQIKLFLKEGSNLNELRKRKQGAKGGGRGSAGKKGTEAISKQGGERIDAVNEVLPAEGHETCSTRVQKFFKKKKGSGLIERQGFQRSFTL